ncbi:tetratricopeptide repeat protein [Chitinophaga barathri]|uniref:Tetratricopeptide repeat protein n=1 Tax=Chitinophaga barathri TaxID=1647451 RepID=A0A3N4MCN9_9BACT|nr:tetratricopeptide repeat protein [Chitinophaga barathri]RPD41175.1 tetratricopeptide repeat protein [Chitinophaga barathri]
MRKIVPLLLLLLFSRAAAAQDAVADTLKAMIDREEYDKVISGYAPVATGLSAKAVYAVSVAFYGKEQVDSCLKYADLSIKKDQHYAKPHNLKGWLYNYLGKHTEAVDEFKEAIRIAPDSADYHNGLGESQYYLKNYDLSLESFKKSTTLKNAPARSYMMIANIYSERGQQKETIAALYDAKTNIGKEEEEYPRALFNIGQLEYLEGNYGPAESALTELIQLTPDDYHAYSNLIQVYYARGEYEKAKPYKDRLYDAHKKELLKDNMKDMFCFDQFKWKDHTVQVFERYEEGPSKKIFNKHLFYVVDKADNIVMRIQTEYSPFSVELDGIKYILCGTKGTTHLNYGIGFNDDLKYTDLKAAVVKILDKGIDPAASTTPANK